MGNELSWAWQAYRLSGLPRISFGVLVLFSLLSAVLDSIVVSAFLPILLFIEGGISAINKRLPAALRPAFDQISPIVSGHELDALLMATFILMCARYAASYYQQSLSINLAARSVAAVRRKIHERVLASDISFHDNKPTGEKFTAIATYPQQVGGTLIMLAQMLVLLLLCLAYAAFMTLISPILMAATGAVFSAIFMAYRYLLSGNRKSSEAYNKHIAIMNHELLEQLNGIRLVKLTNSETRMLNSFYATTKHNLDLYSRVLRLQAVVGSTANPLLSIAGVGVILFGIRMLELPFAELGTFAIALIRLLPVAASLHTLRASLSAYAPSLRLCEAALSEAGTAKTLDSGNLSLKAISKEIVFESVDFAYPNTDKSVLVGLTLKITAGSFVAIVGHSGAGKSTIADLIVRFYDPCRGRITIDGKDIRMIKLNDLREVVALVSQNPFQFDSTVRHNVSFGRPEPLDDEELDDVLRKAHAREFVSTLPGGRDALLGERAVRLSGGQRQRLALARGLAQNPSLLVLDEPTSALDSESEIEITRVLNELRGKTTLIVIAHRLTTIMQADVIHIIDDGRVIASGTHSQLASSNERYKNLFDRRIDDKVGDEMR